MLNKKLFRAELVKNGYTYKTMSAQLGMSERTFYNRVKSGDFGTTEIDQMLKILNITDPVPIFFSQIVT